MTLAPRQRRVNSLTDWANGMERKLLRLSVGCVLPRERHRAWAEERVPQDD